MSATEPSRGPVDEDRVRRLLLEGEIEVLGLLPRSSNATLLTRVTDGELEALAVYKPRRGERPLWDFPRGTLCLREYAAWVLDRGLGWGLVPPTVLREAQVGFGAVQLFIEEDLGSDPLELAETHPEDLRRMAVFDLIANNADRKAGHCVVDLQGRLWSVDHGICFSDEPKLRTVIWAFEGEEIPAGILADVRGLLDAEALWSALEPLLSDDELVATRRRIEAVLADPRFPEPGPGRSVPWPPW